MKTSHSKIMLNKKKIDLAIDAICEIYNVEKRYVLNTSYRKKPVPDARRMLIHYMHNHLDIRHYHIKNYIKCVCHATSIYHCKKLDGYLNVEPQTRNRYLLFRKMAGEFDDKLVELEFKREEIEKMRQEVEELLKEINHNNES